jgi:argonaute-like protein implicated in RNA metabolism and viral defense
VSANSFRNGQTVHWNWGGRTARGKVIDRFDRRVQRTLKGSKIVRNGSKDNPAYLVEQDDGDRALKLGSELQAS